MKKKNRYKRVKEHGYVIIVDGHTTFPKDICYMLDRLDYLEKERLKRSDKDAPKFPEYDEIREMFPNVGTLVFSSIYHTIKYSWKFS